MGELEFEVEIKSPGNVFMEIYCSNKEHLPKVCSQIVPRIDLLQGQCGQVGCLIMVYYSIDGKEMKSKELVEAVDEKNKIIIYKVLEGEVMKLYKTLRFTFQIISKNEVEFVKTKIEYEKQSEDVPCPHNLMDFVTQVTKTIDLFYCPPSK